MQAPFKDNQESKIVFVNPPLSLEERYGKLSQSGSMAPPLGLCSLAAVCRKEGYASTIIDANVQDYCDSDIVELIGHAKAQIIGITASTISIFNASRLADLIKRNDPSKVIIIGGPHVTASPEATMDKCPSFDIGVIGEGEVTIVELLSKLYDQSDLNGVDGIIFRDNDGVVKTPGRDFIKDLDELPMPAWDLLPDLKESYKPVSLSYKRLPSTSLITSRGCSGKCTFCDRKVFGNVCRGFSAEYLMGMVQTLYTRYGIRDILFDDDNFVLFKPRLKKFCKLLKESGLDISWACNARVDIVDKEILSLMKEVGCWQIAYGIESGNSDVLKVLNKGISKAQIVSALELTQKAGIQTKGFFMLGSPLETRATIEETMQFMLEIPLDDFQTTLFTPLPGCDLYFEISRYGVLEDDWSKMNMWNPVFTPKGLTQDELVKYSKLAFRKFYFRPKMIARYLLTLRRKGAAKRLLTGVYSMARYQLFG